MVALSLGIFWLFAIGIKKFHRAFFEKSEFKNFEYFQIFFPPKVVLGHYNPHFITFSSLDMIDIMEFGLEICYLCKKCFNNDKKLENGWNLENLWIFDLVN